ncbi:hypothetical protein [Pedobacter jejuensis]|uniref:Uncharacterized protein n=1 Tax=Pedobacter jejuensis TaxID=1268550 RepID=A0A3N0BR74_9SPHI|nr:hypothetical protein [Pedobacter jejuensis]RNL51155.1 hypothetical protein D7004_15655 [Pedobacter jejuensis]
MSSKTLGQYGISFARKANGLIDIKANSKNLDIYLYLLSKYKPLLEELISTLKLVITGQFGSINADNLIWPRELGYDIYIGEIVSSTTFELYLADSYEETIEFFPLEDVEQIAISLLKFMNQNV